MSFSKGRADLQRTWPWWRLIMTGLIILALILSTVMSWHYLAGGSMAGCGTGSPCEEVLSSRWSSIAGIIPVSGLAMGVYLALLVAVFFIGQATETPVRRLSWNLMLILSGSVAGSAIWFTILQKWIIGDFCPYCMTAHITGLFLSVLVIWRAVNEHVDKPSRSMIRPLPAFFRVVIGLTLSGTMAASQVIFTPPPVYSDIETQDEMPAIDYHSIPVIGSPDAAYIVTMLYDYQCPHCQQLHFMLDEAIRQYNGKLAFAICPVPLHADCNPYIARGVDTYKNSCELAKIAMAVWLADHEAFREFENWMFTFESGDRWLPRNPEAARARAVELVGQEKFDAAWGDPWIGKYLQTTTKIYGQTIQGGMSGVPKLVFNSRWVIPEPNNAGDLITILQQRLEVPMP